jgi:hypothetical protein
MVVVVAVLEVVVVVLQPSSLGRAGEGVSGVVVVIFVVG